MQFLPNGLPHDIGQGYTLGKLPQSLVHQRLLIAAAYFSACFKNRQCVIVYAYRYPRLAACSACSCANAEISETGLASLKSISA